MSPVVYQIAADIVVVTHFTFVSFVLFGQIAILIGLLKKWSWIRNFKFRLLHLLCILFVVWESVSGITCPLTTWENDLRMKAGETTYAGDFIPNLLHNLMFFSAKPWVFTLCYILFGSAVLLTFIFAPPRKPFSKQKKVVNEETIADDSSEEVIF